MFELNSKDLSTGFDLQSEDSQMFNISSGEEDIQPVVAKQKDKSIFDVKSFNEIYDLSNIKKSFFESALDFGSGIQKLDVGKLWKSGAEMAIHPILAVSSALQGLYKAAPMLKQEYERVGQPLPGEMDIYGVSPQGSLRQTKMLGELGAGAMLDWIGNYRWIPTGILSRLPDTVLANGIKARGNLAQEYSDAEIISKIRETSGKDWQKFKDYVWYQPEFFALDVLAFGSFTLNALQKAGTLDDIIAAIPWKYRKPVTTPYAPTAPLGKLGAGPELRQLKSSLPSELAMQQAKGVEAAKIVPMEKGLKATQPVGLIESPLTQHTAAGSTTLTKEGFFNLVREARKNYGYKNAKVMAEDFVKKSLLSSDDATRALHLGKIEYKILRNERVLKELYPNVGLGKAAQGEYWHRSYALFDKPGWKPSLDDLKIVRDRLLSQGHAADEVEGIIWNVMEQKSLPVMVNNKVQILPKGTSALKYRASIDPVLRKHLLGEISEPQYMVFKTLEEQYKLINAGKIYENWAKNPNLVLPEGSGTAKGFVSMPTNPKFGALSGRLVKQELVEELAQTAKDIGWFEKAYSDVFSMWKAGKTIFSPGGHGRNVQWDVILMGQLGVSPQDVLTAGSILKNKTPLFYKMLKYKALRTDFASNEIASQLLKSMEKSNSWVQGLTGYLKKVPDSLGAIWQYPDDLLKAAYIVKDMRTGKSLVDAVARARQFLPYYDEAAPIVQGLRKTVMPFATFTGETLRTTMLNAAIEYPVRTAVMSQIPFMVNYFQKKALNISDEEYNNLVKLMPNYLQDGNWVIVGRDKKDSNVFYLQNLTYTTGITNVTSLIPRPQRSLEENISQWVNHPLLSSYMTAMAGKGSFNKDIYKRKYQEVLPGEKAKTLAGELTQQWLPTTTSYRKIAQSVSGKSKLPIGMAALDLAGIKIVRIDLKESKQWENYEEGKKLRDVQKAISSLRTAVRRGEISPEKAKSLQDELLRQLRD